MYNQPFDEEEYRRQRLVRMQEARLMKRRRRRRQILIRRSVFALAVLLLLMLLVSSVRGIIRYAAGGESDPQDTRVSADVNTDAGTGEHTEEGDTGEEQTGEERSGEAHSEENGTDQVPAAAMQAENTGNSDAASGAMQATAKVHTAQTTDQTRRIGDNVISSHGVLIDADTGTILAQKGASDRISPASMTKILTVLVAAELVENLDDTVTITREITDYSYVNDCSNVGFAENETVTVRDLFYGTILPSGADAAAALAIYSAGSLEAFVDKMNEKLQQLGLSDTAHMTNCVGLYDENHYCTVTDMALILAAALDNKLCREVLSAHTYTTSATEQHPEGITISNWFLRRIEDKETGGEVLYAKTGYVVQSGNCAASFAVDAAGKGYICVTANASSGWRCIYDHVELYQEYMK